MVEHQVRPILAFVTDDYRWPIRWELCRFISGSTEIDKLVLGIPSRVTDGRLQT